MQDLNFSKKYKLLFIVKGYGVIICKNDKIKIYKNGYT